VGRAPKIAAHRKPSCEYLTRRKACSWNSFGTTKAESVADPGFLKGGFSFSLTKTPAQFELKTKQKKKSHQPSILHLLLDDF